MVVNVDVNGPGEDVYVYTHTNGYDTDEYVSAATLGFELSNGQFTHFHLSATLLA